MSLLINQSLNRQSDQVQVALIMVSVGNIQKQKIAFNFLLSLALGHVLRSITTCTVCIKNVDLFSNYNKSCIKCWNLLIFVWLKQSDIPFLWWCFITRWCFNRKWHHDDIIKQSWHNFLSLTKHILIGLAFLFLRLNSPVFHKIPFYHPVLWFLNNFHYLRH